MALSSTHRAGPCPICGGDCRSFPDVPVHDAYPFLTAGQKAAHRPKAEPPKRPKGKRRPAEDRARHLQEDR